LDTTQLDRLLTTTRAVRKRLDLERPVPRSVIEECLEIALQAPNGSNRNQWRWIAIDDRQTIAAAAKLYRESIAAQLADPEVKFGDVSGIRRHDELVSSAQHLADHFHRMPALLVPLIDARLEGESLFVSASLWASVVPAVWSFMLALRARGLGSCWTTVHLMREREMAELLGIDAARYTQVGLFPIAYTLGTDFRRAWRRPLREVLDWNRMRAE